VSEELKVERNVKRIRREVNHGVGRDEPGLRLGKHVPWLAYQKLYET
jgi:hypothetical protein